MIHVFRLSSGSVALVAPVRPLREAVAPVLDRDGETVLKPGRDAETQAEYDAEIIAGALAGFAPEDGAQYVGSIEEADLPQLDAVEEWAQDATGVPVKRTGNARIGRAAWAWDGARVICPAEAVTAHQLATLRRVRNAKLEESDADALKASETGAPNVDAVMAYRQALRDLPASSPDPMAVVWPVKP